MASFGPRATARIGSALALAFTATPAFSQSVTFACATVVALTTLISTPGWGQEVTFADLEGLAIEAEIVREQVNRRDGRTFPVQVKQTWTVMVEGGKTIKTTVRAVARGARRTRETEPLSAVDTLDQPRQVVSQGGGEAVWTFADGVLTYIRTYPSGARRIGFSFARGPDGLTCVANFAFARENGTGDIRLDSRFSGRNTTIVSARQLSSNCRVAKRDQPPGSSDKSRP
jgi:hypothetical protein